MQLNLHPPVFLSLVLILSSPGALAQEPPSALPQAPLTPSAAPAPDESRVPIPADDERLQKVAELLGIERMDAGGRIVIEIGPTAAAPDPVLPIRRIAAKSLEAVARYSGQQGSGTNSSGSVTRGNGPPIKLVALAPGDMAHTHRAQPRLWWYQSQRSESGELEFVLTRIQGRRPEMLLSVPLRGMPQGFNSVDLSNGLFNPNDVQLEKGSTYQWAIQLRPDPTRTDSGSAAVYVKIQHSPVPGLEDAALAGADEERQVAAVKALSTAGNWYELFDCVALLARNHPSDPEILNLRQRLLEDAKLQPLLTAP